MNKYIKYKTLYIKDCPFCGGESTLYQDACNYLVACNKCGVETIWCDTIEQAIEIWNKRFDLETEVEKIEMKNPNNKVYRCLNCGQYMHETSWGSMINYCTFCGMKIHWDLKEEQMQNKTTLDYLIEAQDYITSMCNPNDRTEYQILKEIDILIQKAINHLEKTSEQKKGKWIKIGGYASPGGDPVWKCSECGKGIHVYGIEANSYNSDITDSHQWVTCPNCGASMGGEQ